MPFSTFTWNRIFFDSCLNGNVKRLDTAVYFGLKSAISKMMYRFLDKHFYRTSRLEYDLKGFACEHIGLSRNHTAAKLKENIYSSGGSAD